MPFLTRTWLLVLSLVVISSGCSSGIHDDPAAKGKKGTTNATATTTATSTDQKPAEEEKPGKQVATKSGGAEPGTGLPTVKRGDGTAKIAIDQQEAIEKKAAARTTLTKAGKPPAADDTLLLYYGNDPDTINPITANDTTSDAFQRWVYESLADADMSNPDNLKPSLAERWDFDEKNLEFKIYLRKNVKWHPMKLPNGELLPAKEFTARDVKFSFDCVLNKNIDAAALRSYFEDPDAKDPAQRTKIKVTVIDDYTVKIKWTKPYFQMKEFTLGAVAMMPRHVYSVDKDGRPISFDFTSQEFAKGFNNHWANNQMCGTGPMMFKVWEKDQRLELVRNPEYWDEPFYFNKVLFRNIPNPNTSVELLMQNELDWGAIPEKDRYLQLKSHRSVTAGKVKLVEFPYPAYRYVGYNLRKNPLLKEREVRWALAHAMPVETIINEVYKGLARRTTGPFLEGSSAYDKSLPPIEYNLDKARELLTQAGWTDSDNNGIRDKTVNGNKATASFELMIPADSPQFSTIAEIFKENCRKVGVELKISPAKFALILQKLRKKEFDAYLLGWALGWRQDPFQIWHSSQADTPESSNSIGYQNGEMDKLIEELRVTLDEQKQVPLYHRMHKIIYDDQPYTFLFVDMQTGAADKRLENIKFYKVRPCVDQREWFATTPRTAK